MIAPLGASSSDWGSHGVVPWLLGGQARWGVSGQGQRQEGSLLCVQTVSPEHRRVQTVSCEGNNE